MNPAQLPVAQELFAQWQRARGRLLESASRPFSRGWEDLLEDARLVAAVDRSEACNDARNLASEGWVELKTVRYKSHLIDRIAIPLAVEPRWQEVFGFIRPSDDEIRRVREFSWAPELTFLRDANLNLPFPELVKLNEFLEKGVAQRPIVPIKERSLQIFGEEKRLDSLLASNLFRPGRLDLLAHLRCEIVGVPLAWKRGPTSASGQPVMVIENAATWHSYCHWNETKGLFSAVIYGDGNRFMDGASYLTEIFTELGGPRRMLYFGDLDPQGLRIPQEASKIAQSLHLPMVEPHLWSYRQLLSLGADRPQPYDGEPAPAMLCDWLRECAEPTRQMFTAGRRMAQEHVGLEFLSSLSVLDFGDVIKP